MKAELSQKGFELDERDFFQDGFTEDELRALIGDRSVSGYFSYNSPSFRKMGLDRDELSDGQLLKMMIQELRSLKEKKKEFLKKYPQGQEIIEDKIKRITTPGQGEPHKFTKYQAGGPVGIRNALMMTPVGQQAIQQYAFGGQTTTGGGFTDKTYEERLKGERFLNPLGYKLTDIADTLEDKPPEDPYPYPYLYPKKNISTDDRNGEGQSQGYAQWGADYKDPFVDRRTGLTKEEFEHAKKKVLE